MSDSKLFKQLTIACTFLLCLFYSKPAEAADRLADVSITVTAVGWNYWCGDGTNDDCVLGIGCTTVNGGIEPRFRFTPRIQRNSGSDLIGTLLSEDKPSQGGGGGCGGSDYTDSEAPDDLDFSLWVWDNVCVEDVRMDFSMFEDDGGEFGAGGNDGAASGSSTITEAEMNSVFPGSTSFSKTVNITGFSDGATARWSFTWVVDRDIIDTPTVADVVVSTCFNQTATFEVTSGLNHGGNDFILYTVQGDPSSQIASISAAGDLTTGLINTFPATFYIAETDGNCVGGERTVTVIEADPPGAPTVRDTAICEGELVVIQAFSDSIASPHASYEYRFYDNNDPLMTTTLAENTTGIYAHPTPLTGNTTFYVAVAEVGASCESTREPIAVTVVPLPPAPTVTTPVSTCINGQVTLTATSGEPDWTSLAWYTDNNPVSTPVWTGLTFQTPPILDTTRFYVATVTTTTITANGSTFDVSCIGTDRSEIKVTPDLIITPPSGVTGDTVICAGETTTLTAVSGGGNGSFFWYSDASANNLVFAGNPFTTEVLTSNISYYIVEEVNGCESNATQVNITVNPAPVNPTAAGVSICSGDTANLTATSSGGLLSWYTDAAGTNLVDTGANYTTPELTQTTTFYIQETDRTTGCPSEFVPVTVTIIPLPNEPDVDDITLCVGESDTLVATADAGDSVIWYFDQDLTIQLLNSRIFPIGPVGAPGVIDLYVVAQDPATGCSSDAVKVTITVGEAPTGTPTSENDTICSGETATLSAATTGGTITWYSDRELTMSVGSGTPFTTPVLTADTRYYVQESFGSCSGNPDSVDVIVLPVPADLTGINDTICVGETADLTVTGATETVIWYSDAVGVDSVGTTSSYTTPALTQTTTFYVLQRSADNCPSNLIPVTAVVEPLTNAPTANDDEFCEGEDVILMATSSVGGTLTWYDTVALVPAGGIGTGSPLNIGSLAAGTYNYYVTETLGDCESLPAIVTIDITAEPNPPTVTNDTICNGESTILTATGTSTDITWFSDAGLTTVVGSGNQFNTGPLTATTSYWVTESNGDCVSDSVEVMVVVEDDIPAPTVNVDSISVCSEGSATFTVNVFVNADSLRWYSDASGLNLVGTGSVFVTPALTNTTVYYVGETSGNCESELTPVTVYIFDEVDAPNVLAQVEACEEATISVVSVNTNQIGGDLNFDVQDGSGTSIFTGTLPITSITVDLTLSPSVTAGSYIIFWTVDNDTCESQVVTTVLTVTETPNDGFIVEDENGAFLNSNIAGVFDSTVCKGSTRTFKATSISTTPGNFEWYGGAPSSPGALPTNFLADGEEFTTAVLNDNINQFWVVENLDGCYSSAQVITIYGINPPAAPTVEDDTVCIGESATLEVTSTPTGTINWYEDASASSAIATGTTYTTPALAQTTTYYVSDIDDDEGCESPLTEVTVLVNPLPDAPDATDLEFCDDEDVVLTATGQGGTLVWYGDAILSDSVGSGSPLNIGQLTAGTYSYYVTEIDDNGCESPATQITVTVSEEPDAPGVANDTICEGETATLIAVGTGGTINWYSDAGLTNNIGTGSQLDVSPTVTTTYWVTETIGGCEGPDSMATVVVNDSLPAPTGTNDTICSGESATLMATANSGGTLTWFSDASGTSQVGMGTSFTTPNLTQSTTYYVQEQGTNGCYSPVIPVDAIVNPLPDAPDATDLEYCEDEDVMLMATGQGGTLVWYGDVILSDSVGSGSPLNIGQLTAGTYSYYVTEIDDNGCEGPAAQITVTVSEEPDAPGVANDTICVGEMATLIAVGTGGTINWYSDAGLTNNIATGSQLDVSPTVTTTYWVTETIGGCEGPDSMATVVVNDSLPAPTGTNDTVCSGEGATLMATANSGGTLTWFSDASGTSQVGTGTSYTTPILTQSTTYYVQEQGTDGCLSPVIPVDAIVNPLPDAPDATDLEYCEDEDVMLMATGQGGTLVWYGDVILSDSVGSGSPLNIGQLTAGTYSYYVTEIDDNGCEGPAAQLTVIVNEEPDAPGVANDTICVGEMATLIAVGSGGTINWYSDAGLTNNIGTGSQLDVSPTVTTTYWVTETIGDCEGPDSMATVVVNDSLPAPTGTNDTVCSGESATLMATANSGGTLTWFSDASGTSQVGTGTSYTTPILTQSTTYYVQEQGTNGCLSPVIPVDAIVNPLPDAPDATDLEYCEDEDVMLMATGQGGTLVWYGDVILSDSVGSGSPLNIGQLTAGTYSYYVTEIDDNGCEGPAAQLTVIVNEEPDAPGVANDTICVGEMATLIAVGSGGTINWYSDAGLTNNIGTGSQLDVSPTVTTTYWVTETIGDCEGPDSMATVVVNDSLPAPTGTNDTVCSGESATLIATANSGGTLTWFSDASGTSQVGTGTSYTTPILTQSTTYYVQEQGTNGCYSPVIPVDAIVNPLPDAPDATDLEYCEDEDVMLMATGQGGTLVWYGDVILSDSVGSGSPLNIGQLTAGTYSYYVTEIDDNGCEGPAAQLTVIVNEEPDAPTVINDTICEGEIATLIAVGSGGTINWYSDSLLTNNIGTGSQLNVSPVVTTNYWATETIGDCEGLATMGTVVVNAAIADPVAADDTICSQESATLVVTGSGGTFTWYSDAAGNNVVGSGDTFVTEPLTQTTTFYVEETDGSCVSELVAVTVVVLELPEPPTLPSRVIDCENVTDIDITISSLNVGDSIKGFVLDSLNDTLNFFSIYIDNINLSFDVSDLPVGSYTAILWVDNGCQSEQAITYITIIAQPEAPTFVENPDTICAGSSTTLEAVLPVGYENATVTWYNSDSVAIQVGGNSFTTPNLTVTTAYYATVTDNFGCESEPGGVTVVVLENPADPEVDNDTICQGETATLEVIGATGTITWYSDAAGNNVIGTGDTYTTPQLYQDQTYYVQITSTDGFNCTSNIVAVTVVVNETPDAPVLITNSPICEDQTLRLETTPVDGALYFWYVQGLATSVIVTDTAALEIPNATMSNAGIYGLEIIDGNGCLSPRTEDRVIIYPKPDAPILTSNSPQCEGNDVIMTVTNTLVGANYTWVDPSDALIADDDFQHVIEDVTVADAGTYSVVITSDKGCTSDTGEVEIVITARPTVTADVTPNPVCENGDVVFTATPSSETVNYSWMGPGADTVLSTAASFPIDDVREGRDRGVYMVQITDSLTGCTSEYASVYLFVNEFPDNVSATNDGPACEGESISLSATTIFNATYEWYKDGDLVGSDRVTTISNLDPNADAGEYDVIVTLLGDDGTPCATSSVDGADTASTIVVVHPNPIANAGPDTTIEQGGQVQLMGSEENGNPGIIYAWTPTIELEGEIANIENPTTIELIDTGAHHFELTVTDANACSDVDSVTVTVIPQEVPEFPDIYTPNGDGINDTWVIPFIENLSDYTLNIYARGGALLYTTTAYANDWDGTYEGDDLPDGPYWYVVRLADGTEYKGAVSIVR